jgi:HPt (histidine-containing phosphotransfer) domain-containing protein
MTIADEPPQRFYPDAGTAPGLLDAAAGIERVMGDKGLYQRMLIRYCGDYREGAAPIRRALAGGDLRLAHRLAHTLKGASGMIGATAVHRQAALLESALRHTGPALSDLPALVDPLEHALADVARVIAPLLEDTQEQAIEDQKGPAGAPLPGQELLVARLADLLDRGDCTALDLLDQAKSSLKAALGEQGYSDVASAAHEFDFEAALTALRRAKQEMAGS